MNLFLHILFRFGLHFLAAGFISACTYAVCSWLWRKLDWPLRRQAQQVVFLIFTCLPVALIPSLREAFDVAAGQPILKAATDYVSWFAGTGFMAWLLYRIRRGGF
jgi:hypothetical protein